MLESESRQISIASEAASKKQKQPAKDSLLRNLPISGRHFWKGTLAEQLSATQLDNRPTNKSKRSMPGNELTVMALNEVAISHGRGFFFHVLGRDSWTSWPTEDMHPKSRVPQLPGYQIPSIVYMNYVWSDTSRAAFLAESHRGRYLKSDLMTNPPPDAIPLYAIQYTSHSNQALYITPVDSLILTATKTCFYLLKCSELEKVGGRWPPRKRPPKGPDPEQRLNTAPYLWDGTKDPRKAQALQNCHMLSLEEVYKNVVVQCTPTNLISTFSAMDFRRLIPRPLAPELGLPLGTPAMDQKFKSADPPSRRGEIHAHAPRKTEGRGIKRKLSDTTETT